MSSSTRSAVARVDVDPDCRDDRPCLVEGDGISCRRQMDWQGRREGTPNMDRRRTSTLIASALAFGLCGGCGSLTPRNFRAMNNPAPVIRSGAVGLLEDQPDQIAIPAWIARLEDPDAVVRMLANEGLKGRTRQDFGFVPWAEPQDRAPAVARWRAWWQSKAPVATEDAPQGGLVSRRRKQ
jgi:hypothetical protein